MSNFRQHFLAESINNLTILQKESAEDLTGNRRREAFRTIHTIKGGAQTFGFSQTAKIAGELENILSEGAPFKDKNLLSEGIEVLINSLRQPLAEAPEKFIERLQTAAPTAARDTIFYNGFERCAP